MSPSWRQATPHFWPRSWRWLSNSPTSTPTASTASSSTPAPRPGRPFFMCMPTCWAAPSRKDPLASSNDSSPTGSRPDLAHAELQVDGVAMVRLLGPQDRLLTTIERQYPDVSVLVRGNRVTLEGPTDQVAATEKLVSELVLLVKNGADL